MGRGGPDLRDGGIDLSPPASLSVKLHSDPVDVHRYLSLALEFQLASDILSTSISPTWDEIGKLAATAVIRTGLNFFLSRGIQEFADMR